VFFVSCWVTNSRSKFSARLGTQSWRGTRHGVASALICFENHHCRFIRSPTNPLLLCTSLRPPLSDCLCFVFSRRWCLFDRHTMMMMIRHRKKADRLARSIFDSYAVVVVDHDAGHAAPRGRRQRTIVVAAPAAVAAVLRAGTTIATATARSRHSMATMTTMTQHHCCCNNYLQSRRLCSSTAATTTNKP
jgi:hypothetical protein